MILKRILKSRREGGRRGVGEDTDPGPVDGTGAPVDLDRLAGAPVRSREAEQFREVMTAGGPGVTLQQRIARISPELDSTLLAYVARNGRETEIRLTALAHVSGERLLEEVALHDRVARVRQFAASRLGSESALERVYQAARGRDARVAREARQRLDTLRSARAAQDEARRELERVCAEAERLAAEGGEPHLDATLDRLENRWAGSAEAATSAMTTRFRDAVARCRQRAAGMRDRRQPLLDLCRELERLTDLADTELLASLGEVDRALDRLERLSADDADEELSRRLVNHGEALRCWRDDLRAWHAHQGTVEALLAELQEQPEDAERRQRLAALLAELPWRTRRGEPERLQHARRLLEHRGQGDDRGESPSRPPHATARPDPERYRQAFDTQYQQVTDALDQGDLRRARRLLGRMHKRLEGLPRRQRHAFDERLKPLAVRVQELQDWRRFAVLPKQETLCRRMEELATDPLEPQEQYDAIQALRGEWKALGGSDSRESRQLWERFQEAANRAFEPCRAWFQELHRLRAANLAERERICEQLETFLESRPLEDLDTGALDEIYRTAREAWRSASPVDPQHGRQPKRGFRRSMDIISGELKRRRAGVRQEKKTLIEQARALAEDEDIRAAVAEAKRLQQRWRELGALPPGEERRRHKELQSACDLVFQRLRGEQEGQERRHAEVRQALESLAGDLREALVVDEPERIREALEELRQAYGRAPEPVRRRLSRDVDRLQKDARGALAAQERRYWFAGIEQMRQAAVAVRQLELAVQRDAGDPPSSEEDTSSLPGPLAESLRQRRQQALELLRQGRTYNDSDLQTVAEERRRLCVRAEILAGVDSPPEDEELRMTLQVERLSATLGGGGQHESTEQAIEELAKAWYGLSPWPQPDEDGGWERRFWHAISTMV